MTHKQHEVTNDVHSHLTIIGQITRMENKFTKCTKTPEV